MGTEGKGTGNGRSMNGEKRARSGLTAPLLGGTRSERPSTFPIPIGTLVAMGGGKRILLVEDDAAIRQLVTDLLAESGYQVLAATNGREGLDRVAAWRPDLILLDKLMPEADGTMFAAGYRKMRGRRAPIIGLCASRDGPEWADAIGAATHIVKPFDIDTLLAAVEEQLGEVDRV